MFRTLVIVAAMIFAGGAYGIAAEKDKCCGCSASNPCKCAKCTCDCCKK
jgi:hypothetical protein